MLLSAKVRAYARTMDAGLRMIDEVDEAYRVAVYLELIASYDWELGEVDRRYQEQVKAELGLK